MRPIASACIAVVAVLLSASPAQPQLGIPCDPGTSSPNGFKPCTPCEPGTFTGFQGADHCDACTPLHYAPDPGATACLPCACDDGLLCTLEACVASSGICFATPDPACRAVFRPLGQLPGGNWSTASDVSDDGTVVVGWSRVGGDRQAYRWTAEEGMVPLGDLPGGDSFSEANAVSGDGTLVVGTSDGAGTTPSGSQAFVWAEAAGIQPIPAATPTGDSFALGVSDDGSTIVGYHYFTSSFSAFRAAPAMSELTGLTIARDASADGSIVVGSDATQAKRWSPLGVDPLGWLGTDNHSEALAVTPDGGTVVGWSYETGSSFVGSQPFRWTPGEGLVGLPYRSSRVNMAKDVSDNGALIVGTIESGGTTDHRAFVWTQQEGVRAVTDLMAEYGAEAPEGWVLAGATGVSADGSTIVGDGSGPSGEEAWILTVPAPGRRASALAALAGLACVSRRPARSR